jgi:class 3 adenylate cyclase
VSTSLPAGGSSERPISSAGRRQLTVLFCDLVGSTELSSTLDPEDLREVVLEYQSICATVIGGHDGHIAQYLGDGLLVYFGYPRAHEDDARRAVRTGLGIVDAIRAAGPGLRARFGTELHVRIGIHTGVVVAGEMGAGATREELAVGQAPNVAARVQSLAEPDTVLLSAATGRLVAGFFELASLGPQALKGVAEPVEVSRAVRETDARGRLDVAGSGLTELVGRDLERATLFGAWERTEAGDGQVVVVTGEAGLGKSRLVRALGAHAVEHGGGAVFEADCSPYHQATALYPFIDLLERGVLGFSRDDGPEVRAERLGAWLTESGADVAAVRPLLGSLLGLPPDPRDPPSSDGPERQRQLTIEALVGILTDAARTRPVLFVLEDAHWADPTTRELLPILLSRVAGTQLMVVVTARSDGLPAELGEEHTMLRLDRLEADAVGALADQVAGEVTLPDAVRRQIVDRTDGVPLFIEELTRNIIESGALEARDGAAGWGAALPPSAIPATLNDLLMARLDRLGDAKSTAQVAAVIGREFGFDLLCEVEGKQRDDVRQRLGGLLGSELLVARGEPGEERFGFRHALIQETAYGSLLRADRQALHARVAGVLLERGADASDARPETLAYHLSAAGQPAASIPHWVTAGQGAIARSANIEAISHLGSALDQLQLLDDTPQRAAQEVGLRVLIAVPMTLTRGWANPEVAASYERAKSLIGPFEEVPELFPTRVGILTYHLVRGQLTTASEMAAEELALADRFGVPDFQVEAELDVGTTSYYLGRTAESLAHLDRSLAIYDPAVHHVHAFMYGKDPGAVAHVHRSGALWLLGRPRDGMAAANAGRALSETWSHPFSAIWTGVGQAFGHQVAGDAGSVMEVGRWIVEESIEQRFPNWLAQGQVFLGWAIAASGDPAEGVGLMRQGLGLWGMTGAELFTTYLMYLLADGLRMAGDDEASAVVDEALDRVKRNAECFWEPELLRFRGERALERGGDAGIAAAEADLLRALELSRTRGQPAHELRVATSLARLRSAQGARDDGLPDLRAAMAAVAGDQDSAEVRAARELLGTLEGVAS